MGCCLNKFIYAANAAVANVPTGGVIPLGTLVAKRSICSGPGCTLDGNGITCQGPANFKVTASVTLEPVSATSTESTSAASTLAFELDKDGMAFQGGLASTEATEQVTLPLSVVVPISCCSSGVLTLKMTGADAKITNVTTIVEVM